MSSAKITLLGFYNWMDEGGQDLFAEFSGLPSGVDADTLKQNILLRGGEFEVIYSDPVFFQAAVRPWVKKWYRTIDKWIEALAIKYDPLFNYDRTEEWTDEGTDGKTRNALSSTSEAMSRNASAEDSRSGGEVNDNSYARNSVTETNGSGSETHSGSVETVNEVSAFDSASYQAHDKSTATDTTGIGTTNDQTTTVGGADQELLDKTYSETGSRTEGAAENRMQEAQNAESENGAHESTHKGRMYGNIGVTTSQQMLRDELEIDKFNLIDEITDLFLTEFVVPVYV